MGYTLSNFQGTAVLDKVAKTITVSGYSIPDWAINRINAILDSTAWVIISQANNPAKGIVSIVNNVITLEYDTNTASFANTDVIEIFVNDIMTIDVTTDTTKVSVQNPDSSYSVDVVPLITALQAFTTSFVDIGFEVPCAWYKRVKFWFTLDINQWLNPRIKFLQKHTYAWSEEYPVCPTYVCVSAPATYIETVDWVNAQYFEIDTDADQLFTATVQIDNLTPYIQLQIQIGTDWGTDAEIDALYYTLGY